LRWNPPEATPGSPPPEKFFFKKTAAVESSLLEAQGQRVLVSSTDDIIPRRQDSLHAHLEASPPLGLEALIAGQGAASPGTRVARCGNWAAAPFRFNSLKPPPVQ